MTSNPKLRHKWTFDAIGTTWSVETERPLGVIRDDIAKNIEEFDHTYSRFRDDSLVSSIADKAGAYEFPEGADALLGFYDRLYAVTDGAVSPLAGEILAAAGYDKEYSFEDSGARPVPGWNEVAAWNGTTLRADRPVLLDFGAAGKGRLVDIVARILESNGHASFVVDASGDMLARGISEQVGLENPYDSSEVIGVAHVSDASLCASATNRRAWGEWHHVVDPRTAKPVDDVVATWVVASSAMLADGLATALFFVPAARLREWDFEFVRLLRDGTVERSAGFMGELYV